MRTKYADWIDPEVMRVLPLRRSAFPPGMAVTLSDGGRTVTVGIRPDNPYRPMVKRLVDPAEFKLAEDVLDLTLETSISIDEVGGVRVAGMIPATTPTEESPADKRSAA